MNKPLPARVYQILRIVLSISIILAGVCLMAACFGIYHSGGDQPFSRESVAAAFGPIALPCCLCLGLVAVSFLLELFFPSPAEKKKPGRQTAMVLEKLQEKVDLSRCGAELKNAITAQRSVRRRFQIVGWVLLIVSGIVFLSYGANPHNFHQSQINGSMIAAMYRFVPCCLIPYGYGVWAAYASRRSMEEEIKLLKTAPAESKIAAPAKAGSKKLTVLRNALLLLGIGILVFGYFTGGTADVLTKAVNICTECVGLG